MKLLPTLLLLVAAAIAPGIKALSPTTTTTTVQVLPHQRQHPSSSSPSMYNQHQRRSPPPAMLGGIAKGIADSLRRVREGTSDLWVNARQLGPLKKRFASGEEMSFDEYNLMQKTSGDIAKFVGLALFTLSKPEFTPFLCSFFPAVVPSTYLTSDEKLQRGQAKNFGRVRGVLNHLMNLQQEAVGPKRKETDRMRHLKTMEGILKTQNKGTAASLKQIASSAEGVLFTTQTTDRKGRPKADLRQVPRPFLASVCNSIGMFNKFIPAAGLRVMLRDYLFKIAESDEVLFQTNLEKLSRDDLVDACSQRALSLGDASVGAMRSNLKSYLKCVSNPGLSAPKPKVNEDGSAGAPVALNENNLRFALLGLNMVGLVRDAKENSALRALFGVV